MIRRPYRTKKRLVEYRLVYNEIGTLNRYISDLESEIETFEKYNNFSEANDRKKTIELYKKRLSELKKEGWDIDYFYNNTFSKDISQELFISKNKT